MTNALDELGVEFPITLANPNPKAARLKDGPRYRLEFEIDKDTFDQFMGADNLTGMVIEASARVTHRNTGLEAPRTPHDAPPVDPGLAPKDLLSVNLHRSGYFRDPKLWLRLHDQGLYTLQEHKAFIEDQPCLWRLLSGVRLRSDNEQLQKKLWEATGIPMHELVQLTQRMGGFACQGDVCLHHVSRSDLPAAGKQRQPEAPQKVFHFYGVPLCNVHHAHWAHGSHREAATSADREFLRAIAVGLTAHCVKAVAKQVMGIQSLSELDRDPSPLATFEEVLA